MNAIIEHADFIEADRHTVLTPSRQADFLQSLQLFGNVRLACRSASVSAQTAYRARRSSPGFARAWDAALLAARAHAEATLADRALNGVEEAVYYHGEEVARRKRFDSRLLLAHLARLDRLEERADIAATLPLLDDQIDALRRGEALPDAPPEVLPQDRVPCVPSGGTGGGECQHGAATPDALIDEGHEEGLWLASDEDPRYDRWPEGSWKHRLPPPAYPEWEEDMDDPDHWVDGTYRPPLSRLLAAMEEDRPRGAAKPAQQGRAAEIEPLQMAAFEGGVDEWWLVTSDEELEAALAGPCLQRAVSRPARVPQCRDRG